MCNAAMLSWNNGWKRNRFASISSQIAFYLHNPLSWSNHSTNQDAHFSLSMGYTVHSCISSIYTVTYLLFQIFSMIYSFSLDEGSNMMTGLTTGLTSTATCRLSRTAFIFSCLTLSPSLLFSATLHHWELGESCRFIQNSSRMNHSIWF